MQRKWKLSLIERISLIPWYLLGSNMYICSAMLVCTVKVKTQQGKHAEIDVRQSLIRGTSQARINLKIHLQIWVILSCWDNGWWNGNGFMQPVVAKLPTVPLFSNFLILRRSLLVSEVDLKGTNLHTVLRTENRRCFKERPLPVL